MADEPRAPDASELLARVRSSASRAELVRASADLPRLQVELVRAGAPYREVTSAVTGVTDALTTRLLELLADPATRLPPFTWIACGSQARREQTALSDQDNALAVAESTGPDEDGLLEALSRGVNDALADCGFPRCNGGVMASNPRWRQTPSAWKAYFDGWVDRPSPHSLMHASIFFDMRAVAGDEAPVVAAREHFRDRVYRNDIFLALLAANAVQAKPPLGRLGRLVLAHGGEHAGTFDVKKGAVMPIVDLARVHALAAGSTALTTIDRLRDAGAARTLSERGAADLAEAFERAGAVRLGHHARLLEHGLPLDNHVRADELAAGELEDVKEVFRLVRRHQRVLLERHSP